MKVTLYPLCQRSPIRQSTSLLERCLMPTNHTILTQCRMCCVVSNVVWHFWANSQAQPRRTLIFGPLAQSKFHALDDRVPPYVQKVLCDGLASPFWNSRYGNGTLTLSSKEGALSWHYHTGSTLVACMPATWWRRNWQQSGELLGLLTIQVIQSYNPWSWLLYHFGLLKSNGWCTQMHTAIHW